jgi:hypothetical protein
LGSIAGAVIYEYSFTENFEMKNTLLFMYSKKAPVPGYVDRFKKTREAVNAKKGGAVESEDGSINYNDS